MWGGRQRSWALRKLPGTTLNEPEVVVEQSQSKPVALEDLWLKPALGGVFVRCPECYWDWYSPLGGIRVGSILNAAEEHINRKHSGGR